MEKNAIHLYLDDLRDCPSGFVLARSVEEAIRFFQSYDVGILSLDHDLGEDERGNELPSGYDFVKYFCEHSLHARRIYLHTDNPVDRLNMYETLLAAQRSGFIDPILWTSKRLGLTARRRLAYYETKQI
ncbi:cyclic-phosphate processing receiver domain-containing protein [Paenibacillus methanolicus]|uniref:Cyclic-phosphate processing Receiver domain-containing protein n=1 Tax=Paenibacillus methanolicus TaxID=582686 RepID=A0A5S5BUB9_9BACL|nr:cyclic-phosphate processing receiver domain-containing protein [Paenibacillus methanolicus]TYP69802.1 hypothetical protein BCM02_113134 [Paenibacillus methanolicus]